MIDVLIPMRLHSTANRREHWSTLRGPRGRHTVQKRLVALALAQYARPRGPVRVHLTRQGVRRLDDDNLAASCKHVRDAVAAWMYVDDGDTDRIQFTYAQARGAWALRIRIEPLDATL